MATAKQKREAIRRQMADEIIARAASEHTTDTGHPTHILDGSNPDLGNGWYCEVCDPDIVALI